MIDILNLNLKNKRVVIRVDFNVPLKNGIIIDDFRIKESLKTIKYCLAEGASIVLISHLGRPKGENIQGLSLDPISFLLEDLLDVDVMFSNDCISKDSINLSAQMEPGEIHLLENLRFYNEEIENNVDFSKKLSLHGNVFINDAFATCHRSHASNVGISKFINDKSLGFLIKKELKNIDKCINSASQPSALILGGAKVVDKIEFIENMIDKNDFILVGGAMAFSFLKAMGKNIGGQLIDKENIITAKRLIEYADSQNVKIILPSDFVCAKNLSGEASWRISSIEDIKNDELGYDIGPETSMNFQMILSKAKTIIWNGPLGVTEIPAFSTGTQAVASTVIDQTNLGTLSIIGGGDTASALKSYGLINGFTHISTGGGAFLHLLSGKKLPGIDSI
tara:strand:+ start:5477 stop:6655 length:1179 start_codon:yes stop_codon:yes gene_type:complete